MSLPALKPCPFCGCREIRILPQPSGQMSVNCERCYVTVMTITRFKRQAVAKWNQRREPDPPGTVI